MTRPKDTKRQRLYDAERAFHAAYGNMPTYPEARDVVARVRQIERSAWWKENNPPHSWKKRLTVLHSERGNCQAFRGDYAIDIAKWGRNEIVILHELAHIVVEGKAGRNKTLGSHEKSHGALYARTLLDMVGRFMGVEAKKLLRAKFREFNVAYSQKRSFERIIKSCALVRDGVKQVVQIVQFFNGGDYKEGFRVSVLNVGATARVMDGAEVSPATPVAVVIGDYTNDQDADHYMFEKIGRMVMQGWTPQPE